MASKKDKETDVKIVHLNPRTELNDLEKTAILQFEMEELSKTQEFMLLNKNDNLTNTGKLDLSEIMLPKKKSLYDTLSLALDTLIGKRKKIKRKNAILVNDIEEINVIKKRKLLKDNIDKRIINLNKVNSFQIYSLNIIALTNLSNTDFKARKYSSKYKNNKVNNIHINKTQYETNYDKLSSYAIDKMYYNAAPKETFKYKLYRALFIIFSLVLVISLAYLGNWVYEGNKVKDISKDLEKDVVVEDIYDGEIVGVDEVPIVDGEPNLYWKYLNTPLSSVNFDELVKQNPDTIGWLIVNNTNVDYPVVQTSDNDYYLSHAFDKSKNKAGWVYADYRNEFDEFNQNTVIYAHGRKDRVMFGSLVDTLDSKWYTNKDNQIIQFSTLGYDTMWQIFSIYKIESEAYYITTDFSSDSTYQTFINEMERRSIYDFNVDVTTDDKLLTLSTCYNDYGMRLVVQAKLVKIQKK